MTHVSHRAADVIGNPVEEIIGHRRQDITYEEDIAQNPEKWRRHQEMLDLHTPFRRFEYPVRTNTGRESIVSISGIPVFDEKQKFLGYRGVGTDVTELRKAQHQLQDNERQLRTILEASPIGVAIIDAESGRIRFANARFGQLTGLRATELTTRRLSDLIPHPDSNLALFDTLDDAGQVIDHEIELLHASGSTFWALITIRTMPFQEEESAHFVWIYDISEQTRAKQKLAQLANLDDLTGLANRRAFHDELRRDLARTVRDDHQLAVLYLDLDGFKSVNDNLGHDAGDQVLREVAQRLRHSLREGDLIGRVGGDEFATLLSGSVNRDTAETVAAKLIESVSGSYPIGNDTAQLGVSIGVACCEGGTTDAEELISRADQAIYQAKRGGKGRLAFWSPDA